MNRTIAALIAISIASSPAMAQTGTSYYARAWLVPGTGAAAANPTPSPTPAPTATPTPTPVSDSWTFCSEQGPGTFCNVPAGAQVRYGNPENNSWITKTVPAGPIQCWPDAFGGDPYYGGPKHCEIKGGSGNPTPPPSTPTWTFCSEQDPGISCYVPYATQVRYGVDSTWIVKDVSSSIQCWPDGFGGDPVPGIRKHCEYLTK